MIQEFPLDQVNQLVKDKARANSEPECLVEAMLQSQHRNPRLSRVTFNVYRAFGGTDDIISILAVAECLDRSCDYHTWMPGSAAGPTVNLRAISSHLYRALTQEMLKEANIPVEQKDLISQRLSNTVKQYFCGWFGRYIDPTQSTEQFSSLGQPYQFSGWLGAYLTGKEINSNFGTLLQMCVNAPEHKAITALRATVFDELPKNEYSKVICDEIDELIII